MYTLAKPIFLVCETPLHVGSGSELGIVDLPIQRERHTDFPKVEGSSLKGCFREAFERPNKEHAFEVGSEKVRMQIRTKSEPYGKTIDLAFGPENAGDQNYSGALGFSDGRLLLFPVKSMRGVFAWITCPKVLQRFANDLVLCDMPLDVAIPEEGTVPEQCSLFVKDTNIVLEEYKFEVKKPDKDGACTLFAHKLTELVFPAIADEGADPYACWRTKLQQDLVVLSNDDFQDFVTLSTEVITRTKIDPHTGTVQKGALFTEEYLPAESILYTLGLASPIFKKTPAEKGIFHQGEQPDALSEAKLVMELLQKGLPPVMQLGGNATIGKGLVRVCMPTLS